jgi:DNA-binding winged helix-turn-helix (wHTH) protein
VIFRFDNYELHAGSLELRREGQLVSVDALVSRLLAYMVQHAGRLVTKDELVQEVWEGRAIADNAITVSMARLRKVLGRPRDAREFVATVYGRGYRFTCPVVAAGRTVSARASERSTERHPFVGRENVIASLENALASAHAGRGTACILYGEPGIGKTRTVEEFERVAANSGVQLSWSSCPEGADAPPLWPWSSLLRDVTRGLSRTTWQQALGANAAELIELCRAPRAARGASLGAPPLELHGPERPLVLVLDDLHRADAASLELMHYVLGEIARTRLMIIATMRHTPADTRNEPTLMHILGHRNSQRLPLERLSEADVCKYVSALIPGANGSLAHAISEKSEGNPFFMVELTRSMSVAEPQPAGALNVAGPALELVRQRIARLDADTRETLSAAAVIGRNFELALLSAVTGQGPSPLVAMLDRARSLDVLTTAPRSQTTFVFEHELLRAVLYDGLSIAQRREWHLRVARALEARLDAGLPVPPSDLASHYYAALPEGDLRKTVHYCCEAANAASEYGDHGVVRYLRQALEALSLIEDGSPTLRMRLLFWKSLYSRGRGQRDYENTLREVVSIARERSNGMMLVHAGLMLNPHPGLEPLPGAADVFETALPLLSEKDQGSRALALAGLACTPPRCFRDSESRALFDEAMALAESSNIPFVLYATLLRRLYAQSGPNEAAGAEVADRLEQISQRCGRKLPILPINLALHRAFVAQRNGEPPEQVTGAFERVLILGHKLQHVELSWYAERFRIAYELSCAPSEEQLARLMDLDASAEQAEITGHAPLVAFDRVVIGTELGREIVVDERLRQAIAHEPSEPPSMWSMKLRVCADAGLVDEARALLHLHEPAALSELPKDRDYLGTLAHLTRAVTSLGGEGAYARALYDLLSPFAEHYASHVSVFSDGSVPQLLGMLAWELGEHSAARAHFEEALRMNARAGLGMRVAEAKVQLARALGATTRATSLAQEAMSAARSCGAVRMADRAATLLRENVAPATR